MAIINCGGALHAFSGLVTETAGSPRLGVAIQIPRLNWVLRGSYSRYYQAPPLDTISPTYLSVSPDQGFLPLRGERDEQHDIGLTIPVRGWMLDFDKFRTGAHNFFDHDALGNSNLFIPLTIESVRIVGYEATVRSPKLFKKIDLHLAYSHQSVEGSGGVTGGLTDLLRLRQDSSFLDHDQRQTLSTGFTAVLPHKSWLSGNVSAGSGFLDGEAPAICRLMRALILPWDIHSARTGPPSSRRPNHGQPLFHRSQQHLWRFTCKRSADGERAAAL